MLDTARPRAESMTQLTEQRTTTAWTFSRAEEEAAGQKVELAQAFGPTPSKPPLLHNKAQTID